MATLNVKNSSSLYSKLALKGMSLKQLGNEVGVTSQYLSSVLRGKANPSPNLAKKIADCLGVSVEDIFFVIQSCKS